MAKDNIHICNKEKEITTLEINQSNMALDLKEIKGDIKDMKKTLIEINEHIATAPQKFPSKDSFDEKIKDYDNFKNKININIAYISGAWAMVMFVIGLLVSKFWK